MLKEMKTTSLEFFKGNVASIIGEAPARIDDLS